MDNSATIQQLKYLLICAIGLLLALIIGWNIGSENYGLMLLAAVVLTVGCIALFSGRFFWVLTIASSFLGGVFPILGAKFSPFQILMAIGVAKFFLSDVVLRRTKLRVGNRVDALMILGFMAVLTWHGVQNRFGMRFLGSSTWGGSNYINVYVGLAAYFVVQSIPMRPEVWTRLPYAVLAVSFFDLFIAIITTIWPHLIYTIYPFYSAVSLGGLEEILSGSSSELTQRIGAFGNFGFILMTLVLASASLPKLFSGAYFSRLLAFFIGFGTVLYSGYRSSVLNTVILWTVAGIRDFKVWVIALLPIVAALLLSLSFINSEIFHLPKQVQRGLAFLPGNWDAEMARDAAASNDFRANVWTLWRKDYFPLHPWLGRGFGFRSSWAAPSVYRKAAVDYSQVVEVGNIHNGLFAAVDTFGIIGTVFFVIWNIRILLYSFQIPRTNAAGAMTLRFIALFLSVTIISYWGGAQSVGSFVPGEFALVGVFVALRRALQSQPTEILPQPRRKMSRAIPGEMISARA
jgi:O-antigen ligase